MQYALQRLLALRVDAPRGRRGTTTSRRRSTAAARARAAAQGGLDRAAHGRLTDVEWGTTLVLALLQLRYHDLTNIWSPVVEARRTRRCRC